MHLKLFTDVLYSAPEIEASPVDEPELTIFFFLGGLQTNSVSHISLTVGVEDPLGPAAVCSATGLTRGLWSHRATAHFAGKEQGDVMLLRCTREHLSDALWKEEAEEPTR